MPVSKKRLKRPRKFRLAIDANLHRSELVTLLDETCNVDLVDPHAKDSEVLQSADQDDRHVLTKDKLDFVGILRHKSTVRVGIIRLLKDNALMIRRLRWFLRVAMKGHADLYGRVATLDAEAYKVEDRNGKAIVPRTRWSTKI